VWCAGVAVCEYRTWFYYVNLEGLVLNGEQCESVCERNTIVASEQDSWRDEFAVNFLPGCVKKHPAAWISELYYCHC